MSDEEQRPRVHLLLASLAIFAIAVAAIVGTWQYLSDRRTGATEIDAILAVVGPTVLAAATYFGMPLLTEWFNRRPVKASQFSAESVTRVYGELLAAVNARRVLGEKSQLSQVLVTAEQDVRAAVVRLRDDDEGRPRITIKGKTLPWSSIKAEWDRSASRLVILGQPGYGKTVAALTLIKHINSRATARAIDRTRNSIPGTAIAELFPLSAWWQWQAGRSDHRISDWLADQLTRTYGLARIWSRHLVVTGLVLPVFDGLDELPIDSRPACVDAIEAYAERSTPFRPFVLTCRAADYQQLAPDWVASDREIGLLGLQRDQLVQIVESVAVGRKNWHSLRDQIREGTNQTLVALLQSPLWLSVALQAYRDGDPTELMSYDAPTAKGRLWDLLLELGPPEFDAARADRIRRWLEFIARELKRHGRQVFWLHELYLYVENRDRSRRRFRSRFLVGASLSALIMLVAVDLTSSASLAVAESITANIPYAVLVSLFIAASGRYAGASGQRLGSARTRARKVASAWRSGAIVVSAGGVMFVISALTSDVKTALVQTVATVGLIAAVVYLISGDEGTAFEVPSVTEPVSLRARAAAAVKAVPLAALVAFGFTVLLDALGSPLAFGLVVGVLIAGVAVAIRVVSAGNTPLSAEPPRRLVGRGPSAVLAANATNAVVGGVLCCLLGPVAFLLFVAIGTDTVTAVDVGGTVMVIAGVTGFGVGIRPVLYHWWLRRRLTAEDKLPAELRRFLDWAAKPPREWLRVADGYEFRHRELLDHLANGKVSRGNARR